MVIAAPAAAQTPPAKPPAPEQATPQPPAGPDQGTPADAAPPDQGTPAGATPPDQGTPAGATPPDQGTGDAAAPDADPTAEDLERAKAAFGEGHQLFGAGDFDNAVEKFKEAYRLSKNPLLLYNIGFTHDKRKDRDLALFYYDKFLTDAGPTAQMYDEVKKRVEAIQKTKEADAAFDTGSMGAIDEGEKPRITEFMHKAVEETPPGYPLDITAFVPEAAGWQLTLFYRAAGEERFDSTLMKERYNELVGRIPAFKTTGKTLQYYIEVRDKQGTIVARSGRSASPNLVFVEKEAKPRFYPDVESEGLNDKPIVVPDSQQGENGEPGVMKRVDLGFMSMKQPTFRIVKWSTTGVAVAILAGSLAANRRAAVYSESLEGEAMRSTTTDDCPSGPPCRSFSLFQKDLQKTGQRWETVSYVGTGIGIAVAGAAGYLWYKELTQKQHAGESQTANGVSVVPLVGKDFVGSAATLSF